MEASFLIDTTKCIGCRGCQVACKQWHQHKADKTVLNPTFTSPAKLNARTYTNVGFHEDERNGSVTWNFAKNACMHCKSPSCVSVCPVGAFIKTKEGPVIYRDERCMGCRYCMMACPFDVPKYEWDKLLPIVQKCNFCYDRLQAGKKPACATACPTGGITFNDSIEKNLSEARLRIQKNPGRYVPHIYGEKEAGGTSVLVLSAVPHEKIGYHKVSMQPLPPFTWSYISHIPQAIVIVLAAGLGSWAITRRNKHMKKKEEKDE
jgi:formate dehydrogenase iron-sulfur subunit